MSVTIEDIENLLDEKLKPISKKLDLVFDQLKELRKGEGYDNLEVSLLSTKKKIQKKCDF